MRMIEIKAKGTGNSIKEGRYSGDPEQCPHCHRNIAPIKLQGYTVLSDLVITYRCPKSECQQIFIGYFKGTHRLISGQGGPKNLSTYEYTHTSFGAHQEVGFDEIIQNISPSFPEIYTQASAAEEMNLTQICGMGYRKALEFLIKDYLISLDPNKEEEIIVYVESALEYEEEFALKSEADKKAKHKESKPYPGTSENGRWITTKNGDRVFIAK